MARLKLEVADVEIPEQTTKWIWQHVSGMSSLEVILRQQEQVERGLEQTFLTLVKRRVRREPLQYLLAEAEFAGLKLYVDARVLIPRPETEQLVTLALADIERRSQGEPGKVFTVMDLGTGSGAIIIALAKQLPEPVSSSVRLIATDLSPDALEVARLNAERLGVADRIEFFGGASFSAVPTNALPIDLLISNPPYIPLADKPELQPEVRNYEPELALYGGGDGLDIYRHVAKEAKHVLAKEATLLFEVGHDQAERVQELFADQSFGATSQSWPDAQGIARIVHIQFHKNIVKQV